MIQIIVADEIRRNPEDDELRRDRLGYRPGMSPLAMYDANHGCWVLGPRAEQERYVVFVHGGIGIQAVEIERIERLSDRMDSNRSVIHGTILERGHPIYDQYVGKPAPNQNVRNPVTYVRTEFDKGTPCQCDCGGLAIGGKPFIQGHDQTALHDRVRQIGTVADFLTWFDNLAAPLRQPA